MHVRLRLARHLSTTVLAAALLSACGGGGGIVVGGGGGGGSCGIVAALPADAAVAAEVVLQLRPGHDIAPVASANGLTVISQFGARPIWRLRVAAGDTVDAAVARLRADARVYWAEPNLQGQAPESRRCSVWTIGQASDYATQWAPDALRLAPAHAVSQGDGVRVAVLDTGVDLNHPALASRLARTAGGAVLGRDFVDLDADPREEGSVDDAGFGHGTHVAGLVALAAPQARIMPVRVLDEGGQGNAWVLAEALAWAVDPDGNPATDDGAHVVNFSLGTLRPTRLLEIAMRIAACDLDDDDDEDDFADARFDTDRDRCMRRHGAVVLAAAGNGGSATEKQYPAAEAKEVPIAGALAVTASNAQSALARFANSGAWIHVAAPGEGITSTIPGGGYGTWSGTSMASPLVAGVAAVVIAGGANAPDPQGFSALRRWAPGDVAKRLVDRTGALCGTGLRQVDAYAAVTDTSGRDATCP
ncbi:S8 family serine peptidase [Calidifontimicrobium sp. SYSU G02091]|uniref:S8 family serine peptidase n=1 Tax=Calidifontimicrobium sp. SYSU G02091 TaxID=2926421 RepID=UPI001F53C057|nr:S8 family serine peptidase [Calidifontimicrobium sp. SYSU G02091]MCI1192225.1 S8 family serine peptidase [Calidifontimicrobium sp. SYSU G02091]